MSRWPSRRVTTPMRRPSCSASSWHTPMPGSTRLSTLSTIPQHYLLTTNAMSARAKSRRRASGASAPDRDRFRRMISSAEVFFAVLAVGTAGQPRFPLAQLDAADLAADRLRQLCELQAANPLVRREILTAVPEDVTGEFFRRFGAGHEHD